MFLLLITNVTLHVRVAVIRLHVEVLLVDLLHLHVLTGSTCTGTG